jgi:hypothetical protein
LEWVKGISTGVGLSLLLCSPSFASVDMMIAAHETDSARIDSLERRLPFLEAKVASTLRDGSSSPVSFDGILQMRSQFHNYSKLADSSYLTLARQGFVLNTDQPFLRLGMVVSPGRNATAWATMGLNASFPGYNSYQFLNANSTDDNNFATKAGPGWYYDFQHHNSGSAGRGVTVYEDLSSGIAVRTRPASFMLKMGSMNWMEASPLSIWGASKKAFAWEYLPYEIEGPIAQYYNYKIASLEQVGRGVWNKRAFQGVDFSVIDLPWGLRGFFIYGVGKPFDMMQRYHIDMATDLGYAGDDGGSVGSIIEAGIGDSYRKFVFYRLSKRLENYDVTFGINNGYVRSSSDVIRAGYRYGATFNQKFNIGRYGSEWTNGNETVKILDSASLDKVVDWGENAKVVSLGEGFVVEPNVFSFDAKGSLGKNFRFGFDVGASWVDTHYIRIDPYSYKSTGYLNRTINNPTYDIYNDPDTSLQGKTERNYNHPSYEWEEFDAGTAWNPGRVLDTRTETSAPDYAVYGSATYDFKRIQASLEAFFATENFNSPYSMVNNTDAFWAFGSNMVGSQAFQGMEGAEYSKNLRSLKLSLTPKTPNWHGHLKFGYQLNTQNVDGRDIVAVPYRLNGATFQNTLSSWYSKWGLGTITEGYEFKNNQGGYEDGSGRMQTIAKHTQNRFGDQSYSGSSAPHIGGLRSDFEGTSEVFVPFESPEQVIFNYFSASTVVDSYRDLRNIWNAGDATNTGELMWEAGKFINAINKINEANDGEGIMVTDKDGVTKKYKIGTISGDSAQLFIDGQFARNVAITSNTGFVPVSTKKSFDFNVDWALNIGKYVGYKNDLFLSLYYQINGVTRNFAPLAFASDADNDVLLVSHYLRSEPTIGITNRFYITTLIGFEKWMSGKTWIGKYKYLDIHTTHPAHEGGGEIDRPLGDKESDGGLVVTGNKSYYDQYSYNPDVAADYYTLIGIKQSNFETKDWAFGIGFNWDMMKRVSLHGRYKWFKHSDVNLSFNRYTGNVVSLELKAFF